MIKAAIEKILELAKPITFNVDGKDFSTQSLNPVLEPQPKGLGVSNLTSVVEYIIANMDKLKFPLLVQIKSPTDVYVESPLFGNFLQRNMYLGANFSPPAFQFGNYMDVETFIISLQSKFVPTEDRDIILRLVGNIQDENVRKYGDDGISQTVTAKTGIAKVGEVIVPSPVILKPYRTFTEVDQPESKFIFRMRKGHDTPEMALFEADGGAWRNVAMHNIRDFLEDQLLELVNDNKIVLLS